MLDVDEESSRRQQWQQLPVERRLAIMLEVMDREA